jgi:hypothetical protein
MPSTGTPSLLRETNQCFDGNETRRARVGGHKSTYKGRMRAEDSLSVAEIPAKNAWYEQIIEIA